MRKTDKKTERDLLLVLQDALIDIIDDAGKGEYRQALNDCRSDLSTVEASLARDGD